MKAPYTVICQSHTGVRKPHPPIKSAKYKDRVNHSFGTSCQNWVSTGGAIRKHLIAQKYRIFEWIYLYKYNKYFWLQVEVVNF